MVAFSLSPNPQHQCMPVTADFYIKDEDFTPSFLESLKTNVEYIAAIEKKRAWYFADDAQFYKTPAERDRAFGSAVSFERRRFWLKHLDTVAKEIVDTIPVTRQPGTMRWGRALGMI
jgi:hypothetical protein